MNDSEINVAVAECCGWEWLKLAGHHPGHEWWFAAPEQASQYLANVVFDALPDGVEWAGDVLYPRTSPLPKYTDSRDAMASALATLKKIERISFLMILGVEQGKEPRALDDLLWDDVYDLVTASPRQMATAFLKAKGKWRDV